MRLFLVGWRPAGGLDQEAGLRAMRSVLARLPYFEPDTAESWQAPSGRVTVASVGHPSGRLGGVTYVDADAHGLALFSGRPFHWTGPTSADGRGPLDPAFYRRPAEEWAPGLDGRCTALRYDDRRGELELYTDPLGGYPVYGGELHGTRWLSNGAELVRAALGTAELDLSVTASVVRFGYSLPGDPVWSRVRRLPRGTVTRLRSGGSDEATELLSLGDILPAGRFEPEGAAAVLVAAAGALADWPGRPVLLQLSGGRDSRLAYAAALHAGAEFTVVSTGAEDSPDVRRARDVCGLTGTPHRLLPADASDALTARAPDAARIIGVTSGGAFSLEDAAGYPLAQSEGPLPLWLGGQGGEISRRHYSQATGRDATELASSLSDTVRDSLGLLNERGRSIVDGQVLEIVEAQLAAGVDGRRVPELFYLLGRMGTWAATGFGCVEYGKGDSVSPLWSRGVLPHQLRAAEQGELAFHDEVLRRLAPDLASMPYASSAAPDTGGPPAPVRDWVAGAVAERPSHPAWEVLDRAAVEQLLARRGDRLDRFESRGVWRLATVFAGAGCEVAA